MKHILFDLLFIENYLEIDVSYLWLCRRLVSFLIQGFWVNFCRYDSSSMSLLLHVLQVRYLSKATVRDGYKV